MEPQESCGVDQFLSHTCNICHKRFPVRNSLAQHMRKHAESRPYKCPHCNHRVSQKARLKAHIRSHRLGQESIDEAGVSEGLDGCTSPTKSASACNEVDSSGTKVNRCRNTTEKVSLSEREDATDWIEGSDKNFSCDICGQSFSQAWFLKAHMKKHPGAVVHMCHVCGRRFREAWFLRNHLKSHGNKSTGRPRPGRESVPSTLNDVPQDETEADFVPCLYELCFKCGNLFHDVDSLQVHDQVHSHIQSSPFDMKPECSKSPADKQHFLESLNLVPAETVKHPAEEELGKRIPELDPVCSYQAWHLATKGRLAEAPESGRGVGWEEALADADVAYDRDTGSYVLTGRAKRKREPDLLATAGIVKRRSNGNHAQTLSPGDPAPDSYSDAEYRPSSRQGRRSSHGKSAECFECGKVFRTRNQMALHSRTHRREGVGAARSERCGSTSDGESGQTSRASTPRSGTSPPISSRGQDESQEGTEDSGAAAEQDEKPYICCFCDFVTPDTHLLASHQRDCHGEKGFHSITINSKPLGGCSIPLPQTLLPLGTTPDTRPPTLNWPTDSGLLEGAQATPMDLSVCLDDLRAGSASSPPSQRCSYCSHTSCYPEVLWMHQSLIHKVKSGPLVPCWAPRSLLKTPKEGLASWRRTGPPPALKGKTCPTLAMARVSRTRPPLLIKEEGSTQRKAPVASRPRKSSRAQPGLHTPERSTPKAKHSSRPPREGLGFFPSGKHSQPSSLPAQPVGRVRPHGGATLGSHRMVKQESDPEASRPQVDFLSFLKNGGSQNLAEFYRRWSATKQLLDQTGVLHPLPHHIGYVCPECGKSFGQLAQLRTHMRSHTAAAEFDGVPADTPTQAIDRPSAGPARTAPLRKST